MSLPSPVDAAHELPLRDVLLAAEAGLRAAGIGQAGAKVEFLLSGMLGCGRAGLALRGDTRLSAEQARELDAKSRRLMAHEPLQYVDGHTSFRGHLLHCDKRALVPRPETEQLVEAVLNFEPAWRGTHPLVADVGTGSGCVAIALALARPHATIFASDISPAALDLARDNARRHDVGRRVHFEESDLLGPQCPDALDVVVSNPPYVRSCDMTDLPLDVRYCEPALALDGGVDGLAVLRRLVPQAHDRLRVGGGLFLEMGETQGHALRILMEEEGFASVTMERDMAGRERIAWGVRA